MKFFLLIIFFLFATEACGQEDCLSIFDERETCPDLMRDLSIVRQFEEETHRKLPVHYGFFGHVGYFAMPSARMGEVGTFTAGYSSVPPYSNYFLGFQLFERLEFSGAYRVFKGVEDQALSKFGFGDFSDKGVNFKLGLVLPEDFDYLLPGLSVGWIDFLGSSRFDAIYAVLTQVIPKYGLEVSLGYGWRCYKGFFGGISWMPWWKSCDIVLKNFCFAAEYDAHDYKHDAHPFSRDQKCAINVGMKYLLGKYGNLFISTTRGKKVAMGFALNFDLGTNCGLLPKIDDPLPYQSPMNWQEICVIRTKENVASDFGYALEEQGFCLMQSFIECCQRTGGRTLRMEVINHQWRYERIVHQRLLHLLAFLTPGNIDCVIVVVRTEGMPVQEYRFRREDLRIFASGCMCQTEMDTLSPIREVTRQRKCSEVIFNRSEKLCHFELLPRLRSFFGSARGKLKIGGDVVASIDGYFMDFLYHRTLLRYSVFSQMEVIGDRDLLNPSQLINVNSDRIRYYQTARLFLEEAFIQRNWSMGCGFYGKVGAGFFNVAYAGATAEALYYPLNSCWAVGLDASILKKRTYDGLGLMRTIRKFDGVNATFIPYDYLTQYFLDFYYEFKPAEVEIKVSIGQFLAKDFGVRTEASRYFKNGVKVGIWYTVTNGNDHVNGSVYYDKGIMVSVPFDLFFKCSTKTHWNYSMAAWLRDVGYRTWTGKSLYHLINTERQ